MAVNLSASSFFDLADFVHAGIFADGKEVWHPLKDLCSYLADCAGEALSPELTDGRPLPETLVLAEGGVFPAAGYDIAYGSVAKGELSVSNNGREIVGASVIMAGASFLGAGIRIGRGALVEPGAMIKGPVFIGDASEVRQGAYLRGNCLIGRRCVVGHVTELKNVIFLDDAKAGHFAYLGDSILGNNANLGAGTKLANLRLIAGEVRVRTDDGVVGTGLHKMGAIFGDGVQTGCNSVTNPGTLLGPRSLVLPNVTVDSGYHPPGSIIR